MTDNDALTRERNAAKKILELERRLKEAEFILAEIAGEEYCDDGFNVFENPDHACLEADLIRRAAAWLKGGEG